MRGHIVQRAKDTYSIILSIKDESGKRKQIWQTVRGSRKEAEKRRVELLHQIDTGSYTQPGKSTLGEYLTGWLSDYCKPNLAPRTHELYSYICQKHIFPTIGMIPLTGLKPAYLQHLYADKLSSGLSGRTVQLIHTTLHKSLDNAVKLGLLTRNIAEAVQIPKLSRREPHTMSETDLHLFLDYARDTEYYELFFTYLFTGARRSELLALRWSDIDLDLCQLSITRSMQYLQNVSKEARISYKEPKTHRGRLVSLTPANAVLLREYKAKQVSLRQSLGLPAPLENGLVFCHYDGTPLLPSTITHAWMKLARKCGLTGIRLHDARHTHASLMLKQGVHPKIVQERLGHSTIAITLDLYSHVAPGLQQAAAKSFDEMVLDKIR